MNVGETFVGASSPTVWFLAFFETSSVGWINRLPIGRFKHVSAFAYVPGARVWVWIDSHWQGITPIFIGREGFLEQLQRLTEGATVVKIDKRPEGPMPFSTRIGFSCVIVAAHLIGLKGVVLTPDALYRAVLLQGGTVISAEQRAATTLRSAPADPTI